MGTLEDFSVELMYPAVLLADRKIQGFRDRPRIYVAALVVEKCLLSYIPTIMPPESKQAVRRDEVIIAGP